MSRAFLWGQLKQNPTDLIHFRKFKIVSFQAVRSFTLYIRCCKFAPMIKLKR